MLISLFRGARIRTSQRTPRRRSFVPRLDVLEDRSLPSTLTVSNLLDSGGGSLRGQLAAAASGDTIAFAPGLSGVIALGSDVTLDRNVTILGSLDASGNPLATLTRSGGDYSIDLVVNPGVTASVFGLTLTGATEAAVFNRGSLTLSHVAVTGNEIGFWGLTHNQNGAVFNAGGTLVVQDSKIADNFVHSWDGIHGGGGIENGSYFDSPAGTLTVTNCIVANNWLSGGGGGGIWSNGGTATITACTITGNFASQGGGGIGGQAMTISGCTISNNSSSIGGGIYGSGNGTAAINGCTISGNTAQSGGGIYFASGNGWTLANSTVTNNQATDGPGGGIFVGQRATVTVTNSTIAGNTSSYGAGAIHVANGSVISAGGSLTLLNSTVANNQTAGSGGGLWIGATRTQVRLANTIVAGNTAATGSPDVSGPVLSTSTYNLIGIGDGSSGLINGTNGNQVGAATSPVDARLGPLQGNGGLTQTMALLSGSPAIDAGDSTGAPAYDQRGTGFVRVFGSAIDIGAYEVQPPLVSIGDTSMSEGNIGTGTAKFSVTLSNASTDSVMVAYATADGSATASSDYQATSGTLTFAPGEVSKTITVLINGDRLPEPNEAFTVKLISVTNGTIVDGQGIGTILDDEPRISISDVTMTEGNSGTKLFIFTVSLSLAYDEAVTVNFTTVNGTATTSNKDYVATSGRLTFAAGETSKTITVQVNGDRKKEADETFFLDLFGNSSNSLFTKNRGIGTILNDD
jgi:Calx-beta domain-containing protein/parallel beta helix pectate lyase-like protein